MNDLFFATVIPKVIIDGTVEIETVSRWLDFQNLFWLLIGAIITFITEMAIRSKLNRQERGLNATVLYYDLDSIKRYFTDETKHKGVNIRYSNEWQTIVANCKFLKPKHVEHLYLIYDEVFNYNFLYKTNVENKLTLLKESRERIRKYLDVHKDVYGDIYKEVVNILCINKDKR